MARCADRAVHAVIVAGLPQRFRIAHVSRAAPSRDEHSARGKRKNRAPTYRQQIFPVADSKRAQPGVEIVSDVRGAKEHIQTDVGLKVPGETVSVAYGNAGSVSKRSA